jgi:hypothetical protein
VCTFGQYCLDCLAAKAKVHSKSISQHVSQPFQFRGCHLAFLYRDSLFLSRRKCIGDVLGSHKFLSEVLYRLCRHEDRITLCKVSCRNSKRVQGNQKEACRASQELELPFLDLCRPTLDSISLRPHLDIKIHGLHAFCNLHELMIAHPASIRTTFGRQV